MRFFAVYQVIATVALLPISYWLWWQRYSGDHALALMTISIPIVFAYVIPGIGTNWLRLWEVNARWRLGRFRPHHGFVFGAATSLLALLTLQYPFPPTAQELWRGGFLLGSVLAFWNWLYDTHAIKAGYISVYTYKYHQGADAESIAADYAPILFGVFGCCYGMSIRGLEITFRQGPADRALWPLLLASHVACLVVPVLAYVLVSLLRTGKTGLQSYEGVDHDA
jgi:hypothetical protein